METAGFAASSYKREKKKKMAAKISALECEHRGVEGGRINSISITYVDR